MIKFLRSFLIIGLCMLMLNGCNSARQIAINAVEPAPVSLSGSITRIGVLNMQPSGNHERTKTGMDLMIARDDDFLIEKGMDAAIDGLFKNLMEDPRFDAVVRLNASSVIINKQEGVPDEASWDAIRSLCETHDLDAIFALAYYHTDTEFSVKKTRIEQRDLMRQDVEKKGHELTLETFIENGWRIYDPTKKAVLDEFVFKDQLRATGQGSSPLNAYEAIVDRQDSLVTLSVNSGKTYSSRIKPFTRIIYRSLHVAGTDNFIAGERMIEEKDWEAAISAWKLEVSNDKMKIRAMACHNLAVVYELLENLEEARFWATKAYEYQKSKKAEAYIRELDSRIVQKQQVQEQLTLLGR